MHQSQKAPQTIDPEFLIRSALDRIRLLEAEIKRLNEQNLVGEPATAWYSGVRVLTR